MSVDYVIIGAGLSGCVLAERIANELNRKVLLIEKRSHIGGNCYDYYNSDGILLHKYGPHWFHTNDIRIVKYLSNFTKWRVRTHRVAACIDGIIVPFPINRTTINTLYGLNLCTDSQVEQFYETVRVKGANPPQNAEEMVISKIGWDLYNKFYRNYTLKQWELSPRVLDASITARIPIRTGRNDSYFNDLYQGMPLDGYTAMFNKMIANKNIQIILNSEYNSDLNGVSFKKLIYTGPIDAYFDSIHGKLAYRSLNFEHETIETEYFQSHQQINYPNNFNYTRIIEWKHATGQKHPKTTITREYPCKDTGTNEKFYPILTSENQALSREYGKEARKLKHVFFCGRLADYQYYNMDQAVARALSLFKNGISKQ